MNGPTDIPTMIQEFFDLAKDYVRQETIEPAKRLGRFAAFSFAAALSFALAALFFGIAILRTTARLLPVGPYWSALAYGITVIILVLAIGLIVWRTSSSEGTRV
jgi:putative superfamily III holin-X